MYLLIVFLHLGRRHSRHTPPIKAEISALINFHLVFQDAIDHLSCIRSRSSRCSFQGILVSLAFHVLFQFDFPCLTIHFQVAHQLNWSFNHITASQPDFKTTCNSVLPFNFAFNSSNIEKCLVFHIILNKHYASDTCQFHVASLFPCLLSFFHRVYVFVHQSFSQVILTIFH